MTAVAFRSENKPDMMLADAQYYLGITNDSKRTLVIETWRIDHFRTKFEMPPRQKEQLTQCC